EGANRIAFRTRTSGVMYRLVLRYWRRGADVAPMGSGIKVVRNFYLLGEKGEVVRQLKSGDAVPRGSYLLSEVAATNTLGTNMSYLLVEDFKPSCGEYVPPDDPRFRNLQNCTAYVLREERTAHLAYHHEQTPAAVNDRCVILAELAGRYLVPPARVEMMYQTDMRGHSGSFVLNVVDPK
ncbi:MAG TPA: hypothetical protein VIL46_01090, partial [Gemmataceae bacterium]